MKSNGFFLTRDFDIDTNEDIDFYDLEENGEVIANLMVWGYDKLINDLKILPKKIGEDDEIPLLYDFIYDNAKNIIDEFIKIYCEEEE